MTPQIKQRIDQLRRGEVPEGYTKTKEGIIPSDWAIKKMKQWISLEERPVTLQDDEDYELVTVRRAYGGVDSRGIYKGKDVLVKTYFSVAKDDFIISKRQIAHGACGLVPEKLHGAVVSNEYNVFKANAGTNIHFFNLMMQLPHYKRLFYLMSDGVHIEKLLFKTGDWMKRSLAMPPLTEQKKIAEILSAQDKLIALKEKLIEEKKRQKKYLMQQLLTGKKRLPGFSGEWEKQKMSDILRERKEENKDQSLRICSVAVNSGVVDQREHLGKSMAASDTSNYNVVHYGDIVYTKSPTGAFPYGIVKQSQLMENVAVSPLYGVYEPINYEIGYMLNEYFMYSNNANGYLLPIINKGAKNTINISNATFITPSLYLPTDFEEIKKIVQIFKVANKEIEILQKDLDQEKQKKKALMQLLLSGVVRVKINASRREKQDYRK